MRTLAQFIELSIERAALVNGPRIGQTACFPMESEILSNGPFYGE